MGCPYQCENLSKDQIDLSAYLSSEALYIQYSHHILPHKGKHSINPHDIKYANFRLHTKPSTPQLRTPTPHPPTPISHPPKNPLPTPTIIRPWHTKKAPPTIARVHKTHEAAETKNAAVMNILALRVTKARFFLLGATPT